MSKTASQASAAVADKYLPILDAIEQATGRRPHLCTAVRWCRRKNRHGYQLASRKIGGRRMTTVAEVVAYMEATTAAEDSRLVPFGESAKLREQRMTAQNASQELARRLERSRKSRKQAATS